MRPAQLPWLSGTEVEAQTRNLHLRSSLAIAMTALLTGYALYAVARPATHSFVLWHVAASSIAPPHLPSWLFGSAPTLLHTFAFAILLAVSVGGGTRRRLVVCAAWGAFEIAAEFAQLPAIGDSVEALAPMVSHISLVHRFLGGTFSAPDVVAGLVGTALAMTWVVHSHEVTIHERKMWFGFAHPVRSGRVDRGPL
jgi:hypothetical protein